ARYLARSQHGPAQGRWNHDSHRSCFQRSHRIEFWACDAWLETVGRNCRAVDAASSDRSHPALARAYGSLRYPDAAAARESSYERSYRGEDLGPAPAAALSRGSRVALGREGAHGRSRYSRSRSEALGRAHAYRYLSRV